MQKFPAPRANSATDNAVGSFEFGKMASRSALARADEAGFQCCNREFNLKIKETTMAWTKPEFTDLRFGFEVTMYIANR